MRLQRTIPPAAAPIYWRDLCHGLIEIFSREGFAQTFIGEVKAYFGVKHVFTVSSGKASLTLILRALKSLSPKTEVIIPAYTCFSVPSAIVKAGLKVKLCDIDLATLDFDYKLLEEAVNESTLCVIPSHLFGIPSDMDRIESLCRCRGAYVVEDVAQAMGGVYKGKKLGAIGDVGFFSFGRGKNITCGSGGMIVTNSDKIALEIEKELSKLESPGLLDTVKEFIFAILMKLFIHPALFWFPQGLPFLKLGETFFYKDFPMSKLSRMKQGWMRKWQERLEQANQQRIYNACYFIKSLHADILGKEGIPYLRLPLFVESLEERDRLCSISRERGLGLSVMYPVPINEIEEMKAEFAGETFPCAKDVADKLLAIPVHAWLRERDRVAIAELINGFSFCAPLKEIRGT